MKVINDKMIESDFLEEGDSIYQFNYHALGEIHFTAYKAKWEPVKYNLVAGLKIKSIKQFLSNKAS